MEMFGMFFLREYYQLFISVNGQDYQFNKRYSKESLLWFMIQQVFGKPNFFKKINFRVALVKSLSTYLSSKFKPCVKLIKTSTGRLKLDIHFKDILKVFLKSLLDLQYYLLFFRHFS